MKLEPLSEAECRSKLAAHRFGRIGVSMNALPHVLPVHYCFDETNSLIVIRTGRGTKLAAAMDQAVVAFEIDAYEPEEDWGWSVHVQGRASVITDPSILRELLELPLPEVTDNGDDHFIGVDLGIVTGRTAAPKGY